MVTYPIHTNMVTGNVGNLSIGLLTLSCPSSSVIIIIIGHGQRFPIERKGHNNKWVNCTGWSLGWLGGTTWETRIDVTY